MPSRDEPRPAKPASARRGFTLRGNLRAMAEDAGKRKRAEGEEDATTVVGDEEVTSPGGDRDREGGIGDFVRRAVSAGVGAASRSKDDIMRVAAGEVRTWLERLNLNEELVKALGKMVIEVKTEIRFRPTADGKLVSETTNDVKVKPGS
jgi:hypothetical protein